MATLSKEYNSRLKCTGNAKSKSESILSSMVDFIIYRNLP